MARILVYRGIAVRDLGIGYTLAYKVNSKTPWVYRANLVKYIRYKASNLIKFRKSKEFIYSNNLV